MGREEKEWEKERLHERNRGKEKEEWRKVISKKTKGQKSNEKRNREKEEGEKANKKDVRSEENKKRMFVGKISNVGKKREGKIKGGRFIRGW